MPGEYSQATLEARFDSINKRLRTIEEQLVKRYRELTGANMDQAQEVVVGL